MNSIINKINNTKSLMIGMKPKYAIKLDIVHKSNRKTYSKENVLAKNRATWGSKTTATDFIKIKQLYRLDQFVEEPGNGVLQYLQNQLDGAFVSKELVHITEDTQEPLEWGSKWN